MSLFVIYKIGFLVICYVGVILEAYIYITLYKNGMMPKDIFEDMVSLLVVVLFLACTWIILIPTFILGVVYYSVKSKFEMVL